MTEASTAEPRRSLRSRPAAAAASVPAPAVEKAAKTGSKKRTKDAEEAKDAKVDGDGDKKEEEQSRTKKAKTASSKLAVGDKLPSITLKDDKDADVDISTMSNVVFFIYPKADTPGCTTQACNFRDGYKDFEDLGFKVYGLSADTVAAQAKWIKKHNLGYPLLSDREKALLSAFGCTSAGRIARSHVVVGKEGKIELLSVGVKPANSKIDCLEMVKKVAKAS